MRLEGTNGDHLWVELVCGRCGVHSSHRRAGEPRPKGRLWPVGWAQVEIFVSPGTRLIEVCDSCVPDLVAVLAPTAPEIR